MDRRRGSGDGGRRRPVRRAQDQATVTRCGAQTRLFRVLLCTQRRAAGITPGDGGRITAAVEPREAADASLADPGGRDARERRRRHRGHNQEGGQERLQRLQAIAKGGRHGLIVPPAREVPVSATEDSPFPYPDGGRAVAVGQTVPPPSAR